MRICVFFVVFLLGFSYRKGDAKKDLQVDCVIKSDPMPGDEGKLAIKWCVFQNHLFTSVDTPDYKDRYSYKFQIFRLKTPDIIPIKTSEFLMKSNSNSKNESMKN